MAMKTCNSIPDSPLGVAPDSKYIDSTFALAQGERLTLSDGVVEARNARGEPSSASERTAALSGESADQIASAAQQFGQDDDITVLTLTLAPVEVLHA